MLQVWLDAVVQHVATQAAQIMAACNQQLAASSLR